MIKIYKIILLIIIFIFLSTYNSKKQDLSENSKNNYFKIENIKIENNLLTSKKNILSSLKIVYGKNIFLIKKKDITESLKNINFLKRVEVKKKYPDTIIVKVIETKPIAYLYKNKIKYLLDDSSNLITYSQNFNFYNLPNIFGEKAEMHFTAFFNQLKKNNFNVKNIINYYYFQIGRWDIELNNKQMIKLPYNNVDKAIKQSSKLLMREDFKNYNIIDLRVDGKIIVE
jgi:cell division protein FtsQ